MQITFFNHFSYPLILIAVVIILFIVLRYLLHAKWLTTLAVLGVVLLIALGGFLLLRTNPSDIQTSEQFDAVLQNGTPTFVEFFSNYCSACLAYKPVVDEIAKNIEEDFDVIRIDIHSDFGRDLRRTVNFTFTPEFVVYDASGTEVWRDHTPPENPLTLLQNPANS